jgi:hypothetical protein
MAAVLHLNLEREHFVAIASGRKRIEYRQQKPYWRKRLEGRDYLARTRASVVRFVRNTSIVQTKLANTLVGSSGGGSWCQ